MEPHDIGKLIQGIEINIYQAKSYPDNPGKWHAHISGSNLTEEELRDAGAHPTFDPSGGSRRAPGHWWTDAGSYADTEQEARENACVVIGSIFGQRLAKTLGPQTIPAKTVDPKQRVTLGC